jgi:hypothetical protein
LFLADSDVSLVSCFLQNSHVQAMIAMGGMVDHASLLEVVKMLPRSESLPCVCRIAWFPLDRSLFPL